MEVIKFFLKWFLLFSGVVAAFAGCCLAIASLINGAWAMIVVSAMIVAFGFALAITCFEFMN